MDLGHCRRFSVGHCGTHDCISKSMWMLPPEYTSPAPSSFFSKTPNSILSHKPQHAKRINDQGKTIHFTPLVLRCSFPFWSLHPDFLPHPFLCSASTPGRSGGKGRVIPPSPRHQCLWELPREVHQTQHDVNISPDKCYRWPKLLLLYLVNILHIPQITD